MFYVIELDVLRFLRASTDYTVLRFFRARRLWEFGLGEAVSFFLAEQGDAVF